MFRSESLQLRSNFPFHAQVYVKYLRKIETICSGGSGVDVTGVLPVVKNRKNMHSHEGISKVTDIYLTS